MTRVSARDYTVCIVKLLFTMLKSNAHASSLHLESIKLIVHNNAGCSQAAIRYSHLSINCEGWNKRGGGAKAAKSINVEVEINVEGVQKLPNH